MKTIAYILLFVAFGGFLLTSCTEEETCKQCKIVHYKNGVVVKEDAPEEKCGADLTNAQNETPVVVGDETAKWECN